jgi:periplasmic protein TonB
MNPRFRRIQHALTATLLAWGAVALTFLSGCSTPPPAVKPAPLPPSPPPPPAASEVERSNPVTGATSLARSSKEYRKDAASHLYGLNANRIYKGRLPPLLEAVGVLNVDIDKKGDVKAVKWMRAPQHAPHVMAEIERMVKAAAPYPVPRHLSQVTYTDVWLWHKSGKFQLDTLTEGQD